MEDNSKNCMKTNASIEDIKQCLCIDCIHYADIMDMCLLERNKPMDPCLLEHK